VNDVNDISRDIRLESLDLLLQSAGRSDTRVYSSVDVSCSETYMISSNPVWLWPIFLSRLRVKLASFSNGCP
jgi:hypothetical protein